MPDVKRVIRDLREHATIVRGWIEGLQGSPTDKAGAVDCAGSLATAIGVAEDTSDAGTSDASLGNASLPSLLDEIHPSIGDDMRRRLRMLIEEAQMADGVITSLKEWRDAQIQGARNTNDEQDTSDIDAAQSNIADARYALQLKGEAVADYIEALASAFDDAPIESFVHATDRTPEEIVRRFGYDRTLSDAERYSDLAEQCLWAIRGLAGWFRAHETPQGPSPDQGQWLIEAVSRCAEMLLFPDALDAPKDVEQAFDKANNVILRHQMWRYFQGDGPQVSLLPTDRWTFRNMVRAANHDFYAECAVSPVRLGNHTYPSAHSAAISGIKKIWTAMENHHQIVRLRPSERGASWDNVLNEWGSWELESQVQNAFAMLARERVDARRRLESTDSPAVTAQPDGNSADEISELAALLPRSQSELATDLIKRQPEDIPKGERVTRAAAKQQIKNAVSRLGIQAGAGGRYSGRDTHRILTRIAKVGRTRLVDAAQAYIAEQTQVTNRLQQMQDDST